MKPADRDPLMSDVAKMGAMVFDHNWRQAGCPKGGMRRRLTLTIYYSLMAYEEQRRKEGAAPATSPSEN